MFPIKNPKKSRSVVHGPPARARWQPAPSDCTGGSAEGEEQRRCGGGAEAGPRDRPGAARTGEGWWGRGGRLASGFCSADLALSVFHFSKGRTESRTSPCRASGKGRCNPSVPKKSPQKIGRSVVSDTKLCSGARETMRYFGLYKISQKSILSHFIQ